jgi:hypothetical protein
MTRRWTCSLVLLLVAILSTGCAMWPRTHYPVSELHGLTEDRAIEMTREGLRGVGLDADAFSPVPFRHESPTLFARNELDPETGYVLWKNTAEDSGRVWDYSVEIRRERDRAVVTVHRPK